MKATELRIGNYFFYGSFGHIVQLDVEIFISCLNEGLIDIHKLQPIPLTEDWLIKFGFEQNSAGDYVLNDFLLGYITEDDNLQYEHTNPLMKWGIINVLYVHQLQNLYFALTGEELKLKA